MHSRLVAILPGLALLAGCAINPVTRRPEFVLISAAAERKLGAEQAKKVEQSIGFSGGPELSAYVEQVGARVAAQSPRTDVTYAMHVVDLDEPNAFALPNGDVYVSRGLLVLLNSEDELAGVLGHEIGHVAARHTVQRATRAAPLAIVTGIASGVTGLASPLLGEMVGGVGQAANGLVVAPYSREQERQADELGQQFEAAAGWDPAALSSALQALERDEALRPGGAQRPGFFDSHPSTPERVLNTADYAGTVTRVAGAPISPSRADFVRHLDGVVVGAPASQGVFDGARFLQPDLGLVLSLPEGWRTANGRAQVAAAPSDGSALVVLQMVADGDDPLLGKQALQHAAQAPLEITVQPTTINGLAAAQTHIAAVIEGNDVDLDLTWIVLGGHVYQIAGFAPPAHSAALAPTFDAVARSFHALTAAERASIRETRLRLVPAAAGETAAGIVSRTGTTWSAEQVAVANGVEIATPLPKGELVKVAISEAYAP